MKTERYKFSVPMCAVLAALLFSALILGLILGFKLLMSTPFDDQPFDRAVWKSSHTYEEKEQRAKMVGDLTYHYLRVGMTMNKIVALLGPAEKQTDTPYNWARMPQFPGVHQLLEYNMGHSRMDIAGQNYLLQLYFDQDKHYLSSSIAVD